MRFQDFWYFAICALAATAVAKATVNIKAGSINGFQCPNTNVNSFLSIPYAQPPVGTLRLAPPIAYTGSFSNGTLDATTDAPTCIQFGTGLLTTSPQSEDCLYLNIWTPANTTNSSDLPVKVWIHGGAYYGGGISDPLYNGCNVATDSVVVSIAYRLGALGYLALESAGIDGNFGIQDLILGLKWVQDNIAAFGGDPQKVVVFGQSAGARSAWLLSTLPQAKSLMSAAIAESGAGRDFQTKSEAQAYGQFYAKALGCGVTDIACFRAKSPADLNSSAPVIPLTTFNTQTKFEPFVDGKLIPVEPLTTGSNLPFLAGSNAIEGTLYAFLQFLNPATVTAADYATFLQSNFGSLSPLINQFYPLSLFNSTPYPAFYAISTVFTDSGIKCPTRRALAATSKVGVPTWTYLDAHAPTCGWEPGFSGPLLKLLGATHTAEIPFVFGQLSNLPRPNGTCSFNAQESQISKVLTSAWTSMAANGDPGGAGLLGGPWPQYSVTQSKGLLIANETVVGHVNYTVCDFWEKIAAAGSNGTGLYNGSTNSFSNNSAGSGGRAGGGSGNGSGLQTSPFTGGSMAVGNGLRFVVFSCFMALFGAFLML